MSRRTTLAALTAATALALTACGGSSADTADTSAEGGGSSSEGAFPVTIPNAFGETVIEEEPQRVVVTGFTDVDTVLALGVAPVAFQEFATFPDATVPGLGPWAQDEPAAEGDIQLFPVAEPPGVEDVLALEPDLVIAVGSGLEQEQYDQLSEIVPVLARPEGSTAYLVGRDEATTVIGQALGREDEAQALLDDVDGQLDEAASANPQFAGRTVTVAVPDTTGTGGYGVYVAGDTRVEFFRSLGMELTDAVQGLPADSFFTTVSAEQAQLLDADLVVVPALFDLAETRAQLEADPVFSAIPAVAAGRVLYLDPSAEGGAISYNDVLSVPYALELLLPRLQQQFPA